MRLSLILGVLALPLGYLLGWLAFGLAPLALLALVAGLMLLLAYVQGRGPGVADFAVLTLLIAGLTLFIGGGVALAAALGPSANAEVMGVILPGAALALGVALLLLVPLVIWMRRIGRTARTPAAPWLLLAGILAFVFFPAVRVDCRGLQDDDFLSYRSDFHSHAQTPRWVKHPEQLPDRAELPEEFTMERVDAGLVGCQRQPFTLRPIQPLLVVHLTNKVQPGMQAYAAAFTLSDHHKLTRWVQVKEMPFSLSLRARRPTYRVPGWNVFPTYPEIPPEVKAELREKGLL